VRSGWPVWFSVAGRVCLLLGHLSPGCLTSGKKQRDRVILGRRGNRAKCDFDPLFCGQEISSACGGAWGGFPLNIQPASDWCLNGFPCFYRVAWGPGHAQAKVKVEGVCESSTIRLCNADIIPAGVRQHTASWSPGDTLESSREISREETLVLGQCSIRMTGLG
jgi:hypothetical protein